MKVLLVGHSTVLLESSGTRILLDPFFGRGNLAYRRTSEPALRRSQVGPVAAVLVSHTHFDHFDARYLHSLPSDVPIYTGAAARFWGSLKALRAMRPLRAWQTVEVGPLQFTAVPAVHTGPTVGFVIRDGQSSAYFAGDTYAGRFMAEIGRRFRPQVCLMPVATFRLPLTMGNRGALKATQLLGPATVIPIHLGITPRSPLLRKPETAGSYVELLRAAGSAVDVRILDPGQSFEW